MSGGHLHAVIMAGGSGTRFWPASRSHRPKQLLPLIGGETSLLQSTVERAEGLVGAERCWIVTNAVQAGALPEALPTFRADRVLIEPEPRDTAPCVAFAAARIEAVDPGATLAVMPADHLIRPEAAFHALLRRGAELAADGETLVTFGITPDRVTSDYGYVEVGDALDDRRPGAHRALQFTEKPGRADAARYVESGRFAWNSGIFVWTTRALLAAMDASAPPLAECTRAMLAAAAADDADALNRAFRAAPKNSIDYAVMEKAPSVAVVRAELEWSDLGSFVTLGAVATPDADGNVRVLSGGAQAVLRDAGDCTVYAEGDRTVVVFGARGMVVVAVDDAVLVCPKERAEKLKDVVGALRAAGRTDLL